MGVDCAETDAARQRFHYLIKGSVGKNSLQNDTTIMMSSSSGQLTAMMRDTLQTIPVQDLEKRIKEKSVQDFFGAKGTDAKILEKAVSLSSTFLNVTLGITYHFKAMSLSRPAFVVAWFNPWLWRWERCPTSTRGSSSTDKIEWSRAS